MRNKSIIRNTVLGAALLAAGGSMVSAQAQYGPRYPYRDWQRPGWNIDLNSRAYRDGYQRGRVDAERNRGYRLRFLPWMTAYDRQAYEAGYNRAFNDFQRSGFRFQFRF